MAAELNHHCQESDAGYLRKHIGVDWDYSADFRNCAGVTMIVCL